jgi:hypothetical protein
VALVGGLVVFAAHATGAYFTSTSTGQISGTVGNIQASVSGQNSDGSAATGLAFKFSDLLPGVPQTVTVVYNNTGNNPEDVWINFQNLDALHALNNLGTYGSVTIADANGNVNWTSNNLNDFYPQGTPGGNDPAGNPIPTLYHVPNQMLLQADLQPGHAGTMTFTFAYASKLGNADSTNTIQFNVAGSGAQWNPYPVTAQTDNGIRYTPGAGGSGSGLPFQIVATQQGQTPGTLTTGLQ